METITLHAIKPEPLFDSGKTVRSEVWDHVLDFEKGKKYLVTAPSGKGKSTLLHIIYGLRSDFEGQLQLDSQAADTLSNDQWSVLRQSGLSIVFQDLRLFPKLTGRQNIQLNAQLGGNYDPEKIEQMAGLLGVADHLDRPCHTLSYGQRQRMAIIRALNQPFDMLLLDEPFSHLDEENTLKACRLVEEVREARQAGMIMVSLGEKFHFSYDREYVL